MRGSRVLRLPKVLIARMPELPEVETTRRGMAPYLVGRRVHTLIVRETRLRWPVPEALLQEQLVGQSILSLERRARYLLMHSAKGTLLVHLGMSGSLRLVQANHLPAKHDHVDLVLDSGWILRYTDPRRFGALLWSDHSERHPLLARLGPEPLTADFQGAYLFQATRRRRVPIKPFIMDNAVVVGVGNIYATEALFAAQIDPRRPAQDLSDSECDRLVCCIQQVLAQAIEAGGTTLRDFTHTDGRPGYFQQSLQIYGRAGLACPQCASLIQSVSLGQRTSAYCPSCQH